MFQSAISQNFLKFLKDSEMFRKRFLKSAEYVVWYFYKYPGIMLYGFLLIILEFSKYFYNVLYSNFKTSCRMFYKLLSLIVMRAFSHKLY